MTKASKISLTVFIICFVALSIYGYKIYHERNDAPDQKSSKVFNDSSNSPEATDDLVNDNDADNSTDIPNTNDAVDSGTENDTSNQAESNNYLDVSKTDCANNCKNFTDPQDLKYCQQVCGIEGVKKETKKQADCSDLKNLDKDYCLKDLAINNKDIKICSEIDDSDIQKVCQNRIAADMIEQK